MKKICDVEPFKFTYSILERVTMDHYGPFNDFEEIINFIRKYFGTMLIKFDTEISKIKTKLIDGKRYYDNKYTCSVSHHYFVIVCVESGEIIDPKLLPRLHEYRPYVGRYYNKRDEDLLLRKNNIKKIKQTYRSGYYYSEYRDEGYYIVGTILSSFRRIKTKSERSKNECILKEYRNEYHNLVRGKRRKLPNNYDDIHLGVYDQYKSWKHNSKRRKQWIPK